MLSDLQIRVDESWSEYFHSVTRATNTSGVSDISNISIDFDPGLDRLLLHSVTRANGSPGIQGTPAGAKGCRVVEALGCGEESTGRP
jgi:hypothetical protein